MSSAKLDLAWAFTLLQERLLKMPTRTETVNELQHVYLLREDVFYAVERVASQYLTEVELEVKQHVQGVQRAL